MLSPRFCLTSLLALAFFTPFPLLARLNLPQVSKRIVIEGARQGALRRFFAGPRESRRMPADVEAALLDALEPIYLTACREMIVAWGERVRSTARDSVRVLYNAVSVPSTVQVVLTYRCSSASNLYPNDYDERLAWLTVRTNRSELFLLPHSSDAENDSELSRIESAGVVGVPAGTAVRVRIQTTTENPCCGGPDSFGGEREIWYFAGAAGPEPVLNIKTAEDQYGHSDGPEGAWESHAKTELRLEHNAVGEVVTVITETTTTETGKPPRKTTIRYRWQPARQRFEPASATRLPIARLESGEKQKAGESSPAFGLVFPASGLTSPSRR